MSDPDVALASILDEGSGKYEHKRPECDRKRAQQFKNWVLGTTTDTHEDFMVVNFNGALEVWLVFIACITRFCCMDCSNG
ncbi:hypothetical protein MTO96_045496, partial [Rhipicephalus appendiculatus]